jgi:ankyrin repeat protein
VTRREGGGYEVEEVNSSDEDVAPWQNQLSGRQEVYQGGRFSEEAQGKIAKLEAYHPRGENYVLDWISQEHEYIKETMQEGLIRNLSRITDQAKKEERCLELNAEFRNKTRAEERRILALPASEAEFLALVNLGIAAEVRKQLLMADKEELAYLISLRDKGRPLTHAAVRQHTTDVLRVLLEYGAEVEATDEDKGDTALHVAAGRVDKLGAELVKILLHERARPEVVNLAGQTPVWVAASRSSVLCLKELLQAPRALETVDQPDSSGWTPLQACVLEFDSDLEGDSRQRCAVVRLLLQHGADALKDNKDQVSPWPQAAPGATQSAMSCCMS